MAWIEILSAAVCGGVSVVCALIGASVGARVVGRMASDAYADATARTPSQKFERSVQKMADTPEMQAWARDAQKRGLSPDQAGVESRKMGAKGIARLSDADLLTRARILGRGTQLVDVHTCAELARGTAQKGELFKLLDAVGEADSEALATLASHAMIAELRQSPEARPGTTEDDMTRILATVSSLSGEAAVATVNRVFAEGATDDDSCSGTRVLYDALPRAEPAMQLRMALLLAGQ